MSTDEAIIKYVRRAAALAIRGLRREREPAPDDGGIMVTIGMPAAFIRALLPTAPFDFVDGALCIDFDLDGETVKGWSFDDGDNKIFVEGEIRVIEQDEDRSAVS